MSNPYKEVNPGDPILAADWNAVQTDVRQHILTHTHTGTGEGGAKIDFAALASGADVAARKLSASESLNVGSSSQPLLSVNPAATNQEGNYQVNVAGTLRADQVRAGRLDGITSLAVGDLAVSGPTILNDSLTVGGVLTTTGAPLLIASATVVTDKLMLRDAPAPIGQAKLEVALPTTDNATKALAIGKGTTNYLTVLNNGNIGIGVSPTSALHVAVAKSVRIELGVNHKLSLGGNGTLEVDAPNVFGGRFIVAENGNVGIGLAGPGAKLEVRGAIRFGDGAGAGQLVAGATSIGLRDTANNDRLTILQSSGNVGIGLTDPGAKLEVAGGITATGKISLPGAQQLVFADGDTSNNLKVQLWAGYGLGINGGTLFYAANGRHSWRDNAGTNERMALTTGADGALSVLGTGTSTFGGRLSVGPTVGSSRVSVSAGSEHLQLRRESSEKTGGSLIFLELYQDDTRPTPTVPETYPAIRFHHNNRFWHRLEARVDGLHLKDGNPGVDSYKSLTTGALFSTGNLGLGTSTIENPENWERVIDIRCQWNARLSMRTLDGSIDARVLMHNGGFWNSGPGMIIGTRTPHDLTFATGGASRMWINGRGQVVAKADVFIDGGLIVNLGGWKRFWGPRAVDRLIGADDFGAPQPSDARLKTAVRPITDALRTVRRLTGLRYRWAETGLDYLTRDVADSVSAGPDATADEHRRVSAAELERARAALGGEDIGLLAQDVETVVPEVVHERDGYKHIRYQQLTALLIEAVKEQQALIEGLSARISATEGR